MERALGFFVVFGVILIGALALVDRKAAAPEPSEANKPAVTEPSRTFAWRFETKEAEGELPPRSRVALITGGEVYDVGEYAGSCAEVPVDRLLPGEVAAVLCWWAGKGDEIAVFKEGERHVVKLGLQEESTAESDGFRGDFREYFTLD
ncbi:MAG TPA: hypothetical protein VF696_00695 [Candidatus Paceibacterota bacterium]|jgi:hypothetical protein